MSGKVTLFGEVVRVDGDVRVRLETDELAILRRTEADPPDVGHRGEFTLEGRSDDGQAVVSIPEGPRESEDVTAFDLEFDRLHSALSGRRTERRPAQVSALPRALEEEEVRNWVERVGLALQQLRKHRAKRLNEQVRDES